MRMTFPYCTLLLIYVKVEFDRFSEEKLSSSLSKFLRPCILLHSFIKKTLNSWACIGWLYFRVVHRVTMTVPTPIRHQDDSRDITAPQFFSLSHHMLSV